MRFAAFEAGEVPADATKCRKAVSRLGLGEHLILLKPQFV
jgi:hypothetical protein